MAAGAGAGGPGRVALDVAAGREARRRRLGAPLRARAGCFVVVALAHVFEAFAIVSALGWGQLRSIGHYIDFGATVLGVTFLLVGVIVAVR